MADCVPLLRQFSRRAKILQTPAVWGLVPAQRAVHSTTPATREMDDKVSRKKAIWRVWAELEKHDENQKLRMARLLEELSALAKAPNGHTQGVTQELRRRSSSPGPPRAHKLVLFSSWNDPHSEESSPEGPEEIRLPERLLGMSQNEVEDIIAGFADNARLRASCLMRLLQVSERVLASEPTVLDITSRSRVKVVGDLHGSLPCLTEVLRLCGRPSSENAIVFNGDFVDRGQNSTEVLAAILLMKLAHPNDVYCLRGNHEDGFLATVYGFQKEIRAKYPLRRDAIWEQTKLTFGALPLCAHTAEAFIVHGGLPSQDLRIVDIEKISAQERSMPSVIKKRAPENQKDVAEILQGLVWSDPVDSESGIAKNPKRGSAGTTFGTDVARKWLKDHHLRYLVRSHEMVYEGYSKLDCGQGISVYTVFSAANYPMDLGKNKGAVLNLEYGKQPKPITFDHPGKYIEDYRPADGAEHQTLINLVFAHKNRLREAFLRRAPNLKISVDGWAEVMKSVLGLDIDWKALQPQLVATVKRALQVNGSKPKLVDTGLIDCARFLDRFTLMHRDGGASSLDICDETLEALYSNHEQLSTVFNFLDTDGNGTVSLEEFQAGVKLLNDRLPPEQHLKDADKLFSAVDIDRSGEIDADEFYAIFKVHDSGSESTATSSAWQ